MRRDCPGRGQGSGNDTAPASTKWAAPKDGESHEKMIDGAKRLWCSKCRGGKGMWTKHHKTAGHKTKEQMTAEKASDGNGTPTAAVAMVDACQELHSAWYG